MGLAGLIFFVTLSGFYRTPVIVDYILIRTFKFLKKRVGLEIALWNSSYVRINKSYNYYNRSMIPITKQKDLL